MLHKLLCISLLAFSFGAFCQERPYTFYTIHDGLPQSQIQCMFQDSRGYIWLGTYGGLCFFNGVKFQSIIPKDGLPTPLVRQIQEDKKGNIWFSSGPFICKYDGQKVTYDSINIVFWDGRFFIDKSETAWAINRKDNLLYHSVNFKDWVKEEALSDKKWGSLRYDKKRDRLRLTNLDAQPFAYEKGRLTKLSNSSMTFENLVTNFQVDYGFNKDSIYELRDSSLEFYCKTKVKKILDVLRIGETLYYASDTMLYAQNKSKQTDSISFKNFNIKSLFTDRDSNLWIGAEEGLFRVYPKGILNFSKKQLSGVWSMVEDTEGAMWFGEYFTHKLKKYDGRIVKEITFNFPLKSGLEQGDFGGFYFGGDKDNKGNLYFPMSWGVLKYDGKRFSAFDKAVIEKSTSLYLYVDTVRNIILSGAKAGINIINLENGATTFYDGKKDETCNGFILGITKDLKGRYWMASCWGLAYFDWEQKKVIYTKASQNKKTKLTITAPVFCDKKGGIWVGSTRGLLYYDEEKDSLVLVAKRVSEGIVSSIVGYKDDYLVFGAIDGLYFLDLKAFYTEGGKVIIRGFNQHNGYLGIEPNQNGMYVDSKDNVWVTASDIVTKITPSELDMSKHLLTPYITAINDKRILFESYNTTVALDYGVNSVKIGFDAVGFERPFDTDYRYKIAGVQNDWTDWNKQDFAFIDRLSSGNYTIQVQVRPSGTVDESEIKQASMQFKVSLPFYKSPNFGFYLLGIVALLLGLGVFFYYDRKRKSAEATRQHLSDIERQKELELLNNEMSHRVRNNLGMMQKIMFMQAQRTENGSAKKVLQEGGDRIQAMSLLHDYLITQKGVEFLNMKGYIQELCEKVKISYGDMIQNLSFETDFESIQLTEIFGRHVGLIVSELLTNSIKYAFHDTPQPRISVKLAVEGDNILLTYSDNGSGMPDSINPNLTTTLGLKLIYGIVERFDGEINIKNKNGLTYEINFINQNKQNGIPKNSHS